MSIEKSKNKNLLNELVSLIAIGRHQGGFTNDGIKEYLMGRMKDGKREFTTAEINAALKIDTDLFTSMPKAFGNVDGGALNGFKMLGKLNTFYRKLLVKNKNLSKSKKWRIFSIRTYSSPTLYTLVLKCLSLH